MGVRLAESEFPDHDAPVTALHFLIDDESGESTQMITGDKEGVSFVEHRGRSNFTRILRALSSHRVNILHGRKYAW